uniref:Uncharacterized protein n=1 Tax=Aureoumbra lagunensis TaxID=44058 RepID=A0A7S3NNA6_9STRA
MKLKNYTILFAVTLVILFLPALEIEEWFWQSGGVKSQFELRTFYFFYFLLLVRDFYGCYLFNLSKTPIRSVSKPLSYAVSVFRRPRWCPVAVFRFLVGDDVQWAAFVLAMIGTFILGFLGHSQVLRLTVALAVTIVETRFNAALGWHRCLLPLWTLWTYLLPAQVSKSARVLVLMHSYGGSGLSRLRIARPIFSSLGSDLRLILVAAQQRSLFPRTVAFLAQAPEMLLLFFALIARIGFEIIAVALMFMQPSYRWIFNCVAIIFHQTVALITSIDFVENKLLLCIALLENFNVQQQQHEQFNECNQQLSWITLCAARFYAVFLLAPILTLAEDFPFTPNALFPFSEPQMKRITHLARTRYRLLAYINFSQITDHILLEDRFCRGHHELVTIDLAATYLQCSDTQPAQLYHRVIVRAVMLLDSSPQDAASLLVRWLREDRPLLIPNPTTGTLCEPEGIAILRYSPPPLQSNHSTDNATGEVHHHKNGSTTSEQEPICEFLLRVSC